MGGAHEYLKQIQILMSECGLTAEQADNELSRELKSEIDLSGKRDWLGKRITRDRIRNHSRSFYKRRA